MSSFPVIQSVLDSSGGYFCVVDAKGVILDINEAFALLLLGKGRGAAIGLKARDIIKGSAELKSLFVDIQEGNSSVQIPGQHIQPVHRNAERPMWIKFDLSRTELQDHGSCVFLAGVDVTGIVLDCQSAEQKARERNNFLVRMGHELRTPLNTVLGYAQLLAGLDDLPPVASGYVSTIMTHENNLLHLLNNVLEYSKFEVGQTAPMYSEVDVKKLIQDVTNSFIDQFTDKMLSLTVDYRTEVPDALLVDSVKVTQVISNLLSNALKYTRKGGATVTVSYDRMLTIDVEDTGIGIPDGDRDGIFEVFSRGMDGEERLDGSGIGLVVARIFARMLHGDVELVYSDSGKGSLLRFTFEAKPVTATKKHVQQITDYTSIQGLSRPCRVLLVDDVDINLAMLEIFLAPAGFDVSIASNGNEAVSIFKQFKPDIVFMDLIMPEKDGFEATREIKSISPDTPVIALTASIVDSVKEHALQAGVNDFMYKPFIPERFFEIISEHTGLVYRMA